MFASHTAHLQTILASLTPFTNLTACAQYFATDVHLLAHIPNFVANDGVFNITSAIAFDEDIAPSAISTPSAANAISPQTTTALHAADNAESTHIVATVVIIMIDTSLVTVIAVLYVSSDHADHAQLMLAYNANIFSSLFLFPFLLIASIRFPCLSNTPTVI